MQVFLALKKILFFPKNLAKTRTRISAIVQTTARRQDKTTLKGIL